VRVPARVCVCVCVPARVCVRSYARESCGVYITVIAKQLVGA